MAPAAGDDRALFVEHALVVVVLQLLTHAVKVIAALRVDEKIVSKVRRAQETRRSALEG